MAVSTEARTTSVSIAEAKARFSELVRRVELNGEAIDITRRGRVVARLQPVVLAEEGEGDWLDIAWGMLEDAPEVAEAIDEAFRSRKNDRPRAVRFPWDDE